MTDLQFPEQTKTLIKYVDSTGCSVECTDIFLIYPDPQNAGWYVSESAETSRAGMGDSREAAYADLFLTIARVMRESCTIEGGARLGVKSKRPEFKPARRKDIVKIEKEEQREWIARILQGLEATGEFHGTIKESIAATPEDTANGVEVSLESTTTA